MAATPAFSLDNLEAFEGSERGVSDWLEITQAQIHEFILNLPKGYETFIGEQGTRLSGGERQRLAIARALLRDSPLMIFDEPTSALDTATEAEILAALRALLKNRTAFLIAHRLSTVQLADRIVVLDEGRIAEVGRQAELLAANGLYRRLHDAQLRDPNP